MFVQVMYFLKKRKEKYSQNIVGKWVCVCQKSKFVSTTFLEALEAKNP